jgi:hypothetical protein
MEAETTTRDKRFGKTTNESGGREEMGRGVGRRGSCMATPQRACHQQKEQIRVDRGEQPSANIGTPNK